MAAIPARSPLLTLEAIGLIVLGVIALVLPLFAGLFVSTAIGVLLILVGGIGLASALSSGPHWHRGWSIASARSPVRPSRLCEWPAGQILRLAERQGREQDQAGVAVRLEQAQRPRAVAGAHPCRLPGEVDAVQRPAGVEGGA